VLKIANHCHYFKRQAADALARLESCDADLSAILTLEDDGFSICTTIDGQRTCFNHSFTQPALLRRAKQKNQALIRACGGRNPQGRRVLDLTAGWGRDSFILASQGMQVHMVEQNPLVYACVQFLLEISNHQSTDPITSAMQLQQARAADYLRQLPADSTDSIYLDPMFEHDKKSAKPGKDLQILKLLTHNIDVDSTFAQALTQKASRVVVKRPLHAEYLGGIKPDLQHREKTVRFDVYLSSGK
jgi:16S rRNA (guanine1516-N2)-methyltransferase